jgi:hypothetical protein
MKSRKFLNVFLCLLFCAGITFAQDAAPKHDVKFRVVAIAEIGNKDHQGFVDAAKIYLNKLAAENNFAIDYIGNTEPINDAFLAKYKLFIQLNYPPYMISTAIPCCRGSQNLWEIFATPATSPTLRQRLFGWKTRRIQ